jgi:hypothetical protein
MDRFDVNGEMVSDDDADALPRLAMDRVRAERLVDVGGLVNEHHRGVDLPVGRSRWRQRPFGRGIVIEAIELEHSQGTGVGACTMSLSVELVLRDA